MKWIFALFVVLALTGPVSAESCSKSTEYIREGAADDLTQLAAHYKDLFRVCVETLMLANVKDAYVLKDGGIAIVPARTTLVATALTLAEFCQRFPNGVARILTREELRKGLTVERVVMMHSTSTTSCKKIHGIM